MGQISLWNETLSFCSPPISAQGILFCTSECLKAPPDLLKIYLHESNRVYRDRLVEEHDFEVFDKLQVDTEKKFYEVRVFYKVQGKTRRREQGEEVEEIIRLPALCLDLDISGQHSEEKEQRIEKKECVLVWEGADGTEGQERVSENINQYGMGAWLSGSVLSTQQIGKHFNGFLSTAPLTTLSGSIACTLVMPQWRAWQVYVYRHPQK